MRSPRAPTSLLFPSSFSERERRLQERNETQLVGLPVEGEKRQPNKIKKSDGFTPLVVIPLVREDHLFFPSLRLLRLCLCVLSQQP